MKTVNTPAVSAVMRLFNQLGKADRVRVAEDIGKQIFAEWWNAMAITASENEFSEADIMQEVSAVRYGIAIVIK